jgi:TolC family type I secretion outer membrane protein
MVGPRVFGTIVETSTSCVEVAESPAAQSLTLQQCIDLALKQNTDILKAQQEIRRTHGVIVEARSAALPQVTASGQYQRLDRDSIDLPSSQPFFKNEQHPWTAMIEATQLIYAGGRVSAALRAAKLVDQIAVLGFQRTVADTILQVRQTFYQILLNQAQVTVREESVKLLEQQLTDTQQRFDVGAVPQFNVLRAQVELANARPPLIRAQNDLRLSREALVKLLAIDTPGRRQEFTPLRFDGMLRYEPEKWDVAEALASALAQRPELKVAEKNVRVAAESLTVANAGYKPQLSLFANYGIHDSPYQNDIDQTTRGWAVGAQATWNLFDGMLTRGKVIQAHAQLKQVELMLADTRRSVELEVRQAYSGFLQAQELIEAQKKTVEEAEESLRLAEARYLAGSGTQLEVLSAQTALTEARSNEVQALYDYNVAIATLQRAVGATVKAAD